MYLTPEETVYRNYVVNRLLTGILVDQEFDEDILQKLAAEINMPYDGGIIEYEVKGIKHKLIPKSRQS